MTTTDLEAALREAREGAAYFDNPLEDAIAKCSMWVEGGGIEFDVKDCELILDELRRLRGGRLFCPSSAVAASGEASGDGEAEREGKEAAEGSLAIFKQSLDSDDRSAPSGEMVFVAYDGKIFRTKDERDAYEKARGLLPPFSPRPAPSEAPNARRARELSNAWVRAWTGEALLDKREGCRRAVLTALDAARAEGIAAMRECAAAIADRISTHPDPTWKQVAFLIANSIRGAKP